MEIEHNQGSGRAPKQNNLFSYLRKKNPRLYHMLLKLPQKNLEIRSEWQKLKRPMSRKPFMKKVEEEKRKMQEKFNIIKQSIESKKENHNITNQQIIKECNTLGIKNIARKYSEYKIKESFEIMQSRLKMQNMRRTAEDQHIYYHTNKLNRTISGNIKKRKNIDTTIEDQVFQQLKELHLKATPIFLTIPNSQSYPCSHRRPQTHKSRNLSISNKDTPLQKSSSNIKLDSSTNFVPQTQTVLRKSNLNPDRKDLQRISRQSTKKIIFDTSFC